MKQNFKFILVFLFLFISMNFVSAHTINITFYAESTLSAIPTVTITDSNGSTYTSDVNGLWTADLVGAKSFEISKTGYNSRPLDFYFNEDANYNFLLNPTGLDSNIGFIVKDSNSNLWTNKYLQFDKNTIFFIPTSEYIYFTEATEKSNASWDNLFQLLGTYNLNNIKISKITDQIKTYNASSYAEIYYKFYYLNGTTKNSSTNTTNSTSYQNKTYTNPDTNKPVIKIEIYVRATVTGQTSSSINRNFYSDGNTTYKNVIINSLLTSSSGTATASILANGDYDALLYDATGTLVDTYEKTTVTVNKPKNEVTLVDISPYDITVGGLLGYSLTNQSASSVSFNIFAGTQGFYYFSVVDYNAVPADRKYIPRQYFTQVPMGTGYSEALTYQPYLLLEADAVVPKITVLDQLNKPIGDVDVFISRSINNVQTIVESGKTTSTGNMSFSAYPLEYYYINVIYNSVDKGTFRVQPRESTDNFIIVIDTSDDVVDTGELVITADFSGTPKVVNIDDSNINADITITQSLNQATSYNLYLIQNNVTKASTSGAISGLVTSIDYDFNSSVVDRFNNNLTLKLVVNYPDGNQTFYYTITATKNAKGLMYFAPQIINDIGQPLGIILAILITAMILAGLTFSGLSINPIAITMLGILILGIFMFLGWLDVGVTVMGFDIARFFFVLMAGGMVYLIMRGEKYA